MIGRNKMTLRDDLEFAGYDSEKGEVLLKGLSDALYRLRPSWGSGGKFVDDLTDQDDFAGSECSDSYVSSASTYTSARSMTSALDLDADGWGISKDEEEKHDSSVFCVGCMGNGTAPVHGTVLMLREPYCYDKESFSFVFAGTSHMVDDTLNYHTTVLLGYSEDGHVFLLPTPKLVTNDGVYAYGCPPTLQLSLAELQQYYDWKRSADDGLGGGLSSFKLPLGEECMTCPRLDQTLLQNVYGVSTDRVYYLSTWSTHVRFVGAAWGVIWASLLSVGDVNDVSYTTEKENVFPSFIKPLPYCHNERDLREMYGVGEYQQAVEVVSSSASLSSLGINVAGGKDNCGIFCKDNPHGDEISARSNFDRGVVVSTEAPISCEVSCADKLTAAENGTSTPQPLSVEYGIDNALDFDVALKTLARFGVSHGDRLVGNAGTKFEGRVATVNGVHMGCLLVTMDGDGEATLLQDVEEEEHLLRFFLKATTSSLDQKSEGESGAPTGEQAASSPLEGWIDTDVDDTDGDGHPVMKVGSVTALSIVEEQCARKRGENAETLKSDAREKTSLPFFTFFLKAVAYWKMHLLSPEDQRRQPLAFVSYYGTDTQQRMMEAVDLFRRHKQFLDVYATAQHESFFGIYDYGEGDPKSLCVQRIVQILVKGESNSWV